MQVVTISGFKGGTGKTTLAALLGVAAVQSGIRTAAMDLDRNTRNLFNFLQIRREAGLESPDHVMMMDSNRPAARGNANGGLGALIQMASMDGYELLIIDTSSGNHEDLYEAHLHADVILTPMNESPADMHGLFAPGRSRAAPTINYRDLVDTARFDRDRAGLPAQRWHVCMNRLAHLPTRLGSVMDDLMENLSEETGFEAIWRVSDRVSHRSISLDGRTVFDNVAGESLTMSELSGRSELRRMLSMLNETPARAMHQKPANRLAA